jgi:hypothetical protein
MQVALEGASPYHHERRCVPHFESECHDGTAIRAEIPVGLATLEIKGLPPVRASAYVEASDA